MKFNPVTDEYEPEGPWDEPPRCAVCGDEMERELCEHCEGTGQVDCYEADAINYAPGQDDEPCGQCDGYGGWWLCPQRGDARHEAASVPAPHTWPWFITVRLNARWRDNWTINATVEATCEADALDLAQATLRELLGKDIPRDQIRAVDAPF